MEFEYIVVFVTTTNIEEAKKVADILIRKKLAACINIIEKVESLFWWKQVVNHEQENLLIIKTLRDKIYDIISEVKEVHKYTTPEIIALPIIDGERSYLDWIKNSISL